MQSLGKWALCAYVWLLQKLSMKRLGPQSKTFLLIVLLSISPSKIFQKGLYFSTTSSFSWSSITSGSMTITKVFCTRERFWNRLFYINGFTIDVDMSEVGYILGIQSEAMDSLPTLGHLTLNPMSPSHWVSKISDSKSMGTEHGSIRREEWHDHLWSLTGPPYLGGHH